jgi:hypothetical protein
MRNFGAIGWTRQYNPRSLAIRGEVTVNPNPADTALRDRIEVGGYYLPVPDRPPAQAAKLNAEWQVAGYNWNPTTVNPYQRGSVVPPGHRAGRDTFYFNRF